MTPLFKKLNLKEQNEILILNAPISFESELAELLKITIHRKLDALSEVSFALAFVTHQEELNFIAKELMAKVKGDALLWFAYPKQTSKKYRCDFNRDSGWGILGAGGFEGVRQVAIDADWSALRFRRANFIKSITRDSIRALSADGKARALNK